MLVTHTQHCIDLLFVVHMLQGSAILPSFWSFSWTLMRLISLPKSVGSGSRMRVLDGKDITRSPWRSGNLYPGRGWKRGCNEVLSSDSDTASVDLDSVPSRADGRLDASCHHGHSSLDYAPLHQARIDTVLSCLGVTPEHDAPNARKYGHIRLELRDVDA